MSAFDVEVRVRIPADQFKHIHQVAVTNNTTAASLVVELVRRGLTVPPEKVRPPAPPKPPAERRPPRVRTRPHKAAAEKLEGLVRLHGLGFSDGQIAHQLGMSDSWVGVHRNRLNLPRNAQPGPRRRNTQPEGETA